VKLVRPVLLLAIALAASPHGDGSQKFNVQVGAQAFSYELPAGAVTTFVIPAT